MTYIRRQTDQPLTPQLVLALHKVVTDKTLDNRKGEGCFRTGEDDVLVADGMGTIFHRPPPAAELPARIKSMCKFANGNGDSTFIHPVIRAIIVHFWLAHDHPFVDGNGRTARALFYWSMLSNGYWLFDYVSISHRLRRAPAAYARSFLYTETDDNDLTYFIIYQLQVIKKAIGDLHGYLEKKITEIRETEQYIRGTHTLNHRQLALISHALRRPSASYTFKSHKRSHNVVYETARTDLLDLAQRGFLVPARVGREMRFGVPDDLEKRLREKP